MGPCDVRFGSLGDKPSPAKIRICHPKADIRGPKNFTFPGPRNEIIWYPLAKLIRFDRCPVVCTENLNPHVMVMKSTENRV